MPLSMNTEMKKKLKIPQFGKSKKSKLSKGKIVELAQKLIELL
jgi:hypothetical protein